MAEDGESSLDHAFAKVCDIFGFEPEAYQAPRRSNSTSIRNEKVMCMSIFRLITGSKLYHGIFASVDKCEKNIEIVISPLVNLVKDQVRRLSLLGVSTIALSDISTSAAEVKKGGEWRIS